MPFKKSEDKKIKFLNALNLLHDTTITDGFIKLPISSFLKEHELYDQYLVMVLNKKEVVSSYRCEEGWVCRYLPTIKPNIHQVEAIFKETDKLRRDKKEEWREKHKPCNLSSTEGSGKTFKFIKGLGKVAHSLDIVREEGSKEWTKFSGEDLFRSINDLNNSQRLIDINRAISVALDCKMFIPTSWIEERNNLLK